MTKLRFLSILTLALALSACGDEGTTDPMGLPENAADAVANYSNVVHATYDASHQAALELQTAVNAFLDDPSEGNLSAARQAWIDARLPYLESEVFRFYDGPIDGADGEPEGQINAWPLDENLIDYVEGDDAAGLINDPEFEITAENLLGQNGIGGEKDVATGWHPIEFLLWGQDLTDPAENLPGQRPATDFTEAENADRRAQYLSTVTDLLVEDLAGLKAAWEPGAEYRTGLEADAAVGIQRILTGMIVLSGFEVAGERLQAALDEHDQEEEHSCFSDTTSIDMLHDVIGVRNVWKGTFGSQSGVGIYDVVNSADAELAARLDAQIDASVAAAEALQNPFDLEIAEGNAEGNARVQALIDSLRDQEAMLTEVFQLFEFSVPQPE